jgi:UDP-N-acetylglucosamine acyltransferase
MAKIDPTARVADGAVIGDGATIGPFCIIGKDVTIGPGCHLIGSVHIAGKTSVGANTTISPFASLGTAPQSLGYRGELTELVIGEGCTIREGVTMNTGTAGGGGVTRVGARGYYMNNAHVGHDCIVGDDVIFATSATLGGHCEIGDNVFMGGLSAAHQHSRIGTNAMVGGLTAVRSDVIPYGLVNGQVAHLEGLNVVGMKRRKFTAERLRTVRLFYRALFHGAGNFADRLVHARTLRDDDPAIALILDFIDRSRHRGLCQPVVGEAH